MQAIKPEDWYRVTRFSDDVTLIDEPAIQPFYRCNIWHIRGRDRDLLFDTGLGAFSLREHVALVRERPIVCVASHTHFDHIGSHHEFADRRVHPAEAEILAAPDGARTLADKYADERMFDALPVAGIQPAMKCAPRRRHLCSGTVICSISATGVLK